MLANRTIILDRVSSLAEGKPPQPWNNSWDFDQSGIVALGFFEDSDHLLVVCHHRRLIVDCSKSAVIAVTEEDGWGEFLDQSNLTCSGIGPYSQQRVSISGLFGGGGCRGTSDGWRIVPFYLEWWRLSIVLVPPGGDIFSAQRAKGCVRITIPDMDEFRFCGFSPTGKSLVAADASGILVYSR